MRRFERSSRVAVVGVSAAMPCGVSDHAHRLAAAMGRDGMECSVHWLYRQADSSVTGSRAEIGAWSAHLGDRLRSDPPDAILLHYSVFSYSHRGVPLFVHPVLSALRGSRAPLISLLHEFAYPWRRGGLRGGAWAVSQRAALIELVRDSRALVVTTDARRRWLVSRRWLPARASVTAPVFSNLPPSGAVPPVDREQPVIGFFGYGHEAAEPTLALDAIRLLRERGRPVNLRLLGAPGRDSQIGASWLAAAGARGVADALSFSGTLAAQELADALAECDMLLFLDSPGPTSRKTTLAASLASGRPVVAIDGPDSWSELVEAQALRLVPASADALAHATEELLADEDLRRSLGAVGRAFAHQNMDVAATARALATLVQDTHSSTAA